MKPCVFCEIAAGREVASKIYEDDDFIVIMDIFPLGDGHVLVIPKLHCVRLHELNSDLQTRLFDLGHRVFEAQKKAGYGQEGGNLLLNDGKAANQTVPHLHLHLIPRKRGDLLTSIPKLMMHIAGIFGVKPRNRSKLDEQAAEIKAHFIPPANQ